MLYSGRVALSLVVLALFAVVSIRPAHAVGDARLNVAGASPNEITLVLTDSQGKEVKHEESDRDRAAGYWTYPGLPAGTYYLKVLRNGRLVQPSGSQSRVVVRDGEVSSYRINGDTGAVALVASMAARTMAHWSFGVLGGFKMSPFMGNVSSDVANRSGSERLDGTWGQFGVEGRYYFNPAQQMAQQGLRLFLYGTYVHYFGSPLERFILDDHPTSGKDVGAGVDEKWSGIFGIGANLNIAQRLGLGIMLGAHATQVETSALADETGGGGANNRFTHKQYVFGPVVAAELFYPFCVLQGIGTIELFSRGQLMWMPDTTVDGTSSNNFHYHARVEGGTQGSLLFGTRLLF